MAPGPPPPTACHTPAFQSQCLPDEHGKSARLLQESLDLPDTNGKRCLRCQTHAVNTPRSKPETQEERRSRGGCREVGPDAGRSGGTGRENAGSPPRTTRGQAA